MPQPKGTTSADPWADLVQAPADPWADLVQAPPAPTDEHTVGGAVTNLAKMPLDVIGGLAQTAGQVGSLLLNSSPPGAEFGAQLAKDPIGTLKQTASGALQLAQAVPGQVGAYLNRYNPTTVEGPSGPTSNLRETLYHTPTSVLMDASMATKAAGLVPGLRGVAAAATDPTELMARPITAGLQAGASKLGDAALSAYTKALKVPDTIRRRNPDVNIPATGLALRRAVSGEGIEQGSAAIGNLEDQVGAAIDQSPATRTLTEASMPQASQEVQQAIRLSAADPAKARFAPARLRGFLQDPNISTPVLGPEGNVVDYTPKDLPMRSLQDMKVRLNQMLASRFGKDNTSLPQVEMNQAIRSDLRQTIADAVPGVADLNAQLGPQYALQDALEHRVPVAARQNVLPMRAMIGSTLAGGLGLPRKLAGALIGAAVDNPAILSQVAFGMDASAKRLAGLAQTTKALAPYATVNTFAQNVAGVKPTGNDARKVGQIATQGVQELQDQPGFAQLPIEQQMRAIDQVVSDVGVLTGGVAEVTRTKPRATTILKGLKAAQTTERP